MKFISLLIICFCTFLSCKTIEKTSSKTDNNLDVSKKDTGSTKTDETTNKKEDKYWKETVVFHSPKDSVTNNNYYSYPQPAVIYREGGSKSEETNYKSAVENWLKTLNLNQKEKTEKASTVTKEMFTMPQIIGLFVGFALFIVILLFAAVKLFIKKPLP